MPRLLKTTKMENYVLGTKLTVDWDGKRDVIVTGLHPTKVQITYITMEGKWYTISTAEDANLVLTHKQLQKSIIKKY